jgi:hypothetical protein
VRILTIIGAVFVVGLSGGCGDDDEPDGATREREAAIVIEAPAPGTSVTSPVLVEGTASVFEGTVQIRIVGSGGEVLASTFATATEGAPGRGDFTKRISFTLPEAQEGVIEAYQADAASGSEGSPSGELFRVSVPVQLQP